MVHNFASVIALAIHAMVHSAASNKCTTGCNCYQEKGRPAINCNEIPLTKIPLELPSNVWNLYLNRNPFNRLKQRHAFKKAGVAKSLHMLSMTHCNITYIVPDTFTELIILQELYLSHNFISEISSDILYGMPSLEKLVLAHNRLTKIIGSPFSGSRRLATIDLSYNYLDFLGKEAFNGLDSLKEIRLEHNKFKRLLVAPFRKLTNLATLGLAQNPWSCDCTLREFKEFEQRRFLSSPPECHLPTKYKGKKWGQLTSQEFSCPVLITDQSDKKQHFVKYGQSVTLMCGAVGDPRPTISWELRWPNKSKLILQPNTDPGIEIAGMQTENRHHPGYLSRLTIKSVQRDDLGQYHCLASNIASTEHEVFQIQHVSAVASSSNQNNKGGLSSETTADTESGSGESGQSLNRDWLIILVIIGTTAIVLILAIVAIVCFRKRQTRPAPIYTHMNGNGYKVMASNGNGSGGGGGHTNHATTYHSHHHHRYSGGRNEQPPEKPNRTYEHGGGNAGANDNFSPAWFEPVHVAALEKQKKQHQLQQHRLANSHPDIIAPIDIDQPIIVADTRDGGRGLTPLVSAPYDEVTYMPKDLLAGFNQDDSGYLEPDAHSQRSINGAVLASQHRRPNTSPSNSGNGQSSSNNDYNSSSGPTTTIGIVHNRVHIAEAPLARVEIDSDAITKVPLRETSL